MKNIITNSILADDLTSFISTLPSSVNYGDTILPFKIIANETKTDLCLWVAEHKEQLNQILHRFGGVLFKGFNIDNAEKLNQLATAHADEGLLDYIERGAPRIKLANNIFTSTEYAKEEVIPMHHEMSYSHNWPVKLYFCSEVVAQKDGYTPLADDRKVIELIPDEIKQKFIDKKVMYVRNYGLGIDMSWQDAFQTTSKAEVEEYLTKSKTSFEWLDDDVLRTKAVRQAIATHPITNDTVWFNHAHLFHSSNLPADIREIFEEEFGSEGMPRNAYYGDGTVIEDSVVSLIRDLYDEHAVRFDWEQGDALFVDNFLLTHGRSSFEGERKVCVAMSDLYTNKAL